MGRAAVAISLLTGCAQLAGIDSTSGGDVAKVDASFTVQRVSVGATLVNAPQDLSASRATFLVSDDADPTGLVRVPSVLAGVDTWTAPDTASAAVLFDLPDYPTPIQRIFDFPNPAVKALFGVMEHPNPQPAPAAATIAVNLTLDVPYVAGDTLQLYTLGVWNQRALDLPAVGTTALASAFDYATMTSITGRPHERLTQQDAAVVLRYTGNQLAGAYDVPPFDQTGTDTITGGTLATVLATSTLDVRIDPGAASARFGACRPPVGNVVMQWGLRAAPGGKLNNDNGPLLHAATVATLEPQTVAAAYGNPFAARGWGSTFTWLLQATRVYTPPSVNLPVTLLAQMHQRAVPSPALMLTIPAGLPTSITIDGTPLTTDGQTLAKPTKGVDVAFVADLPAATFYQVQLFELVPNLAGTALELKPVLSTAGAAAKFRLPPELFKPGSLYTVRAVSVQGGYPAIGDGDLTVRELPIAVSLLDSGVFQVTP